MSHQLTAAPSQLSALQQRHISLKARAAKVAAREDVVSIYHLGDVIAEIEADQALHGELGQITEAITLNRVIARLKALLPLR